MTNAITTGGDKERYFEEIEKIYSKIKALREKLDSLQTTVVETPECNKEIKRIEIKTIVHNRTVLHTTSPIQIVLKMIKNDCDNFT